MLVPRTQQQKTHSNHSAQQRPIKNAARAATQTAGRAKRGQSNTISTWLTRSGAEGSGPHLAVGRNFPHGGPLVRPRATVASNTIPPLNPEVRGMSGPEPPPTEARLHDWLFQYFLPTLYKTTLSNAPPGAVPRRFRPCQAEQDTAKSNIT